VAQPGPLAAKGILQGRIAAASAGWPVRSGTGPDGAFVSQAGSEFVMVLGSRRVAVDVVAAFAGEVVQVEQTADLSDTEVITFGYHFQQAPVNADGLYWTLVVLLDSVERYRHQPAPGTEAFFTRRQIYVEDLAGDHDITMRLQLEG